MVKILIMSAKMATPALLKIKVFWNKGYYVIYSVYDVINKILSHDSNYYGCGHVTHLKVRKFWGLIPTFVEVTGEKLVGETFWPPILNRVKGATKLYYTLFTLYKNYMLPKICEMEQYSFLLLQGLSGLSLGINLSHK